MSFANTDELFSVLRAEAKRHPALRPADVGTLLYENEFGPAAVRETGEELCAKFKRAMSSVEYEEEAELYEFIGNGRYRLNLAALDPKEYPLARVASDYKSVAGTGAGTVNGLLEKTAWVTEHFSHLGFRFSEEDWESYLKDWEEQDFSSPEGEREVPGLSRGYLVIDGSVLHDFRAERKAETPKTDRILVRIVIGLALLLLAVGMTVLGKYLTGVILK